MMITANHLTVLRVIILPLPYFLLYGGTRSRIAAICVFAALGLTDYLDGLIARRYGPTELGKLLDPIADKIFLAATLVPLVDLGVLPLWIVWTVFLREFLVTELRACLMDIHMDLPVTELAKIKTTIQMTVAGLVLLTDTFPDKFVTAAFLSGAFLATAFLAIGLYWRDGHMSQRIGIALALLASGLVLLAALDTRTVILSYGFIMLAVTLASGGRYLIAGLPACLAEKARAAPGIVLSLSVFLAALALAGSGRPLSGYVILILSLGFTAQGIDMWAFQTGKRDISAWWRYLASPAALCAFAALPALAGKGKGASLFLLITLSLAFSYLVVDIWMHRTLFGGLFAKNPSHDHPRGD